MKNTMTDTTLFEAVITQANGFQVSMDSLVESIYTADTTVIEFEPQFDAVQDTIDSVKAWAAQKILESSQEEVMTNFMAELKVVFDKYAAQMEIGNSESGYGESYGTGSGVGVKFTASFDGITSTKEINKAVIVGADLV